MEKNFQTSFIPKKPMIEKRVTPSRPIGLLTLVSLFVFFTLALASLALYFYDGVLKSNIAKLENTLTLAEDRFEPSRIVELQELDKRLRASTGILDKHIAVSPIFEALEAVTMKTVSFTKFDFSAGEGANPQVEVVMKGRALGYQSVALQSDLFSKNKYFIDPIFSNLVLDDAGNVVFDLKFKVDANFVDYKNAILGSSLE